MKSSEKLLERLRSELGLEIPEGCVLRPLRRGRWGMASGAWAWEVTGERLHWNVGSEDTIRDCLKSKKLSMYMASAIGSLVVCS